MFLKFTLVFLILSDELSFQVIYLIEFNRHLLVFYDQIVVLCLQIL